MLICSYFPNGCEVDITIKEDFPEEKLVEFIDAFAEVNFQLLTAISVYSSEEVIKFNFNYPLQGNE